MGCRGNSNSDLLPIEWIQEIEAAANHANTPVFEKNNLKTLIKYPLRQEMPAAPACTSRARKR